MEVSPPGTIPYPVLCGRDPGSALATVWQRRWKRVAVVADHTTEAMFANSIEAGLRALGCEVLRCTFTPGEASKTRVTKAAIEDAMLAAGFDRRDCVVALGGGIVLDVAGFVAATFMRGIAHVNVATTLLAQVDAAIGGKTAINTAAGKNLIGALHHPRAVLLDLGALELLPADELRCGLAEAIKHGVLSDAALFAALEHWAANRSDLRPPDELIRRCVEIKAEVVEADDRDQGIRHILNYGHTVAHAVELASGHATPHGQAVAIGMVVEARLACRAGNFPPADVDRLARLLRDVGLPVEPPCSFAEARVYFASDKKTEAGVVRCAIPARIGHTEADPQGRWARPVSLSALEGAWKGTA